MDKKQTVLQDDFEKALEENGIELVEEEKAPEGIGAIFSPRTTAPSTSDKNWIHYSKGGYNYCIKINASTGSCLPNCVGYAWGRWRELLGKKPALSRANAEEWWGTKDGYSRGQTPKVGAVACWRKGKAGVSSDGAGHVAIVEKVASDGTVTFSNSNYSGTRFFLNKMKKPYNLGSAFAFQGFIYLPVDYEPAKKTSNISLSGANYPKSIKKGQYFTIKGKINSTLPIKRVEVGIVDAKTGKYIYHYDNKSAGGKKVFDIHNADSKMQFRKLKKGSYIYRIYAWDANGAHRVMNKTFKVV